jgi:hypothetical protein
LYFLLACKKPNTATHYRTTTILGDPHPQGHPGCPHHLVASDGQFPESIGLNWVAGAAAVQYQIFRKAAQPGTEWELAGVTTDTKYLDSPMPDYKVFFYRVRAANANGESCWSNIDSGFAGGGKDPCIITGDVTTIMGEPIPGVKLHLVGLGEHMVRATNEEGKFLFADLPPDRYVVAPCNPELQFYPEYHFVDLREVIHEDIHFNAAPEAALHNVRGFVFTFVEGENRGTEVQPMVGVEVSAHLAGHPDQSQTVETNEHGYYRIDDLEEGINLVRAAEEGYAFFPPVHEVVVDGLQPVDRRDFVGYIPPEDGGGGDE